MENSIFQKTIAIDFDNTITSGHPLSEWEIPPPRKNAAQVINAWIKDGYIVIINTMRDGGDWELAAREYLKKYGINFDYYNENSKERIRCYGNSRKIGCDISIDDTNLVAIPRSFIEIDRMVRRILGDPYTESELNKK